MHLTTRAGFLVANDRIHDARRRAANDRRWRTADDGTETTTDRATGRFATLHRLLRRNRTAQASS